MPSKLIKSPEEAARCLARVNQFMDVPEDQRPPEPIAKAMAERCFRNDRIESLRTHLENRNTVHPTVINSLLDILTDINNDYSPR